MPEQRQIVYRPDLQLYLFWDSRYRQYYHYDSRTDELVYEDRARIRRPDHTPRTYYQNPCAQTAPIQIPGANYSSSPPNATSSRYTLSTAGEQQYVPRSQPSASPDTSLSSAMGGLSMSGTARSQIVGSPPMPVVPYVHKRDGLRIVDAQDQRSYVKTSYATEPKDRITDGALYRQGIDATRYLLGTPGQSETLYPGFSVRTPGHKFFVVGRVFLVLWVEPAGESRTVITSMAETVDPAITKNRFQEKVFSKVRRFVVIRAGKDFCSALPIVTYSGRGVSKQGVTKSDHAIIYTEREPRPLNSELPDDDEQGMREIAIQVTADNKPRDKLDPMSRIDFAKVHTIQHNIKVKAFGMVHPHCIKPLLNQFKAVWNVGDSDESGTDDDDAPRDRKGKRPVSHAAVISTAARAERTQSSYYQMIARGASEQQALGALAEKLCETRPDLSWETAVQTVRGLLVYGTTASQQRPSHTMAAQSTSTHEQTHNDTNVEEEESGNESDNDELYE